MKWTEKQIETYLESETRELVGADGCSVWVTLFKAYWITFDAILVSPKYTEARLIDWARDLARTDGTDVASSLKGILEYADDRFKHHFNAINQT